MCVCSDWILVLCWVKYRFMWRCRYILPDYFRGAWYLCEERISLVINAQESGPIYKHVCNLDLCNACEELITWFSCAFVIVIFK
jgi:hypothetical protein